MPVAQSFLLVALRVALASPRNFSIWPDVLSKKFRLTAPSDFSKTTKSGLRVGGENFLLYIYRSETHDPARCGLIISKNVGGSVARHKVARRIRHEMAKHLPSMQPGSLVVIRANTGAAQADVAKEIPSLITRAEKKLAVAK